MNYKKIATALILFMFVASALTATVNAQFGLPPNIPTTKLKTYSIVDAIPDVIGVGETTLLKTGVTQALNAAEDGFINLKIIVTKPDGTNETLGPFRTDSTGSTYAQYTPTEVGTYIITSIFPEQPMPVDTNDMQRGYMIPKGTTMLASSASTTLVVRAEASQFYPDQPLPSEYWTRPIDDQLRSWYAISGNWVARPDNSIALYNADAPETPHVLWAEQLTSGGIAGGLLGDGDQVPAGMHSGDAYEGKFSNSVIINGILYYNTGPAPGFYGPLGANNIKAVDLHTGKTVWQVDNQYLAFGQTLYWNGYNVDGVYNYLWTTETTYDQFFIPHTTWHAYDPFDFAWCFDYINVPSGIQTYGPSGEILIYQLDTVGNRLMLWNSTNCGLQAKLGLNSPDLGSWASNVMMQTWDASNPKCYSWNVSIPAGLQVIAGFFGSTMKIYYNDRIVGMYLNQTLVRTWALNIKDLTKTSTSASLIFDKTWSAPSEWLAGFNTIEFTGATNYVHDAKYGDGVIAVWDKELTTHYGFSVVTGNYLWATSQENYADAYGLGNAEHTWYFAYGKLYSVGIGGILYAYDLSNGHTAWTYNLTDPYGEPVTGNRWWGWIDLIVDDKIYIGTLEHSAENPLPRGAPYICVNATDGSEIFRINGLLRETRWGGNPIIGDSIIAGMDTYDQRIYALGKGPSTMTLTAAPKVSIQGSSVLVEGTVMDNSPGTQSDALKLRFPNGVAAVSDASQSQWMLYLYKQFAAPSNATGVPVTISVLDANGNYRTVGTTTSDSTGAYSFSWIPDIPGKYTVYATFAGSLSYYASAAETAIVVDQPAATQPPAATPAPSMADLYFLPMSIAIILAVIVIGAILALLLVRKHP
jgi:hypothetical protein